MAAWKSSNSALPVSSDESSVLTSTEGTQVLTFSESTDLVTDDALRSAADVNSNSTHQSKKKKPSFEKGQLVDEKFYIQKKISDGGFGRIYEITPVNQPDARYAMKLALANDKGTDQSVKMEIGLLRRLSKQSPCFPKFQGAGTVEGYRYFVMDLLGPSLADVQGYMPEERFSIGTSLRAAFQLIDAIEVIHSYNFIHRDIKPGNMAIGLNNPQQIYVFDFGLARRFVRKDQESEELRLKTEREKSPFRGTYHYCSLQQHKYKDACRRDDLWSLMYTLIEFITAELPWEKEKDKLKIEKLKQDTPLSGCPSSFAELLKYLDTLDFHAKPSYEFFRQIFRLSLKEHNLQGDESFDWEIYNYSTGEESDYSSSLYSTSNLSGTRLELSSSAGTSISGISLGLLTIETQTATTRTTSVTSSIASDISDASSASTGTTLNTNFSSIFTDSSISSSSKYSVYSLYSA